MIGDRIKKLRSDTGLSQVEFAQKIGVSKQTLYKYENGIVTNIPSDKIEAIAHLCGVSPAYIMGWDDDVKESQHQADYNGYYLNDETARVAQEIFEDRDLRILFDAARDSSPDDLRMAADLLRRLKGDR